MTHLITLPNGLLDGADLFNLAEINELSGRQQNYLADKELVVGNIGHVPKILEDLVVSLQTPEGLKWQGNMKEAIYKLSSGDLETILIKIRELSYGPKFYFEAICPHCDHKNKDIMIQLDSLVLDKFSVEQILDKKSRTVVLPKSGLEVELKPLYLKDLFDLIKATQSKQHEIITATVSIFIKRLGEKTKVTSEDIKDLPAMDIAFLNEQVAQLKLEGSIDSNITSECSSCKQDFDTRLNVFDPSFFVLSKGFKTIPT